MKNLHKKSVLLTTILAVFLLTIGMFVDQDQEKALWELACITPPLWVCWTGDDLSFLERPTETWTLCSTWSIGRLDAIGENGIRRRKCTLNCQTNCSAYKIRTWVIWGWNTNPWSINFFFWMEWFDYYSCEGVYESWNDDDQIWNFWY